MRDGDAGERGTGVEEAEGEHECETSLLPLGELHLDHVGEDEDDEPDVGGRVDDCGGGHEGVVLVAGADRQCSLAGEGVADDCGEGDEDRAVETYEADG